jgi:hypothetical protein
MTEETGTPKTPTSKKSSQLAIFSEQPLLDGEDPAVYKELFEHISVAVKPLDIFEEIPGSVRLSFSFGRFFGCAT